MAHGTYISYLGSFLGSLVIPVLGICDPWLTTVQVLDRQLVLRVELGKLSFDVSLHERLDVIRGLRRDQPTYQTNEFRQCPVFFVERPAVPRLVRGIKLTGY